MTINVEYNQLDPLLRATINAEGDVNDDTGFSPFPGAGYLVAYSRLHFERWCMAHTILLQEHALCN